MTIANNDALTDICLSQLTLTEPTKLELGACAPELTEVGVACHFPFIYEGVEHTECTNVDEHRSVPHCRFQGLARLARH